MKNRELLLTLIVGIWLSGCGSGLSPAALPNVHTPEDARRSLFATLSPEGKHDRVFELEFGHQPGELTAVSATAVLTLDREGRITSRIPFSGGQKHFPITSVDAGGASRVRFLGVLNEKKTLALYDGNGGLVRTIPCRPSASFAVGDVTANPGPEILLDMERGLGLEVYSIDGGHLGRILSKGYLTAFHVARRSGNSQDSIVLYTYPNKKSGGDFQVLTGEGKPVAEWSIGAISDFGVVDRGQAGVQLLYARADRLILSSLRGEVLAELNAPGASLLKRFSAQQVEQGLVVLGSGNGYTPYHSLWIYDRQNRLRFSDTSKGHAYGMLVRAPEDPSILVGSEGEIWEYRLDGGLSAPNLQPSLTEIPKLFIYR